MSKNINYIHAEREDLAAGSRKSHKIATDEVETFFRPSGILDVLPNDDYAAIEPPQITTTTVTHVEKPLNPKDAIGIAKVPLSCVPMPVMQEVGLALMEGGLKYGRHNWRAIGVRASVYFDATMRHLAQWWEGEDVDAESGLSHVTKAISSLTVLRDAMIQGKVTDDRPISSVPFNADNNNHAAKLLERFPNPVPAFTQVSAS